MDQDSMGNLSDGTDNVLPQDSEEMYLFKGDATPSIYH